MSSTFEEKAKQFLEHYATIQHVRPQGSHWGHRAWNALHAGATITEFEKLLPACGPCREMYERFKAANPPPCDPPPFEWGYQLHDMVNCELGKCLRPTLEEARQLHPPATPAAA